eukprot:gene16872-20062_t
MSWYKSIGESAFVQWYKGCLTKAPLITKSLTSGVIFAIGDVTAQKIEGKKEIKLKRTMMMSTVGIWFKIMDYAIPGTTTGRVLTKVAFDQLMFCPFIVSTNFTAVNFLKNGGRLDVDELKAKISNDLFTCLKQAWTIWPITNFLLFKYIPIDYRLLLSNLVSVYWNTYLSLVANRAPPINLSTTNLVKTWMNMDAT